jgi:hypothetical protein
VLSTCVFIAAFSAAPEGQQQPASEKPQPADPVSAERIREGLKRPELQLPPLPPPPLTFRAEVEVTLETPLDVIRRELATEARGSLPTLPGPKEVAVPLVSYDVLPAIVGLVNKIKAIRREHAEADARRMVQAELDAFCQTHDCSTGGGEPLSEGVIAP